MAQTRPDPGSPAGTGQFRPIEIGEPIPVLLGTFRSPIDQGRYLGELNLRRLRGLTLVAYVPLDLPPLEVGLFLDLASGIARTVVVTTSPSDPGPAAAMTADDLRSECRRDWTCPVRFEPDPRRAVIGAMQALRAGDAFAVVWPDDPGLPDPAALIVQGARWRASLESDNDGDFFPLPPQPGTP